MSQSPGVMSFLAIQLEFRVRQMRNQVLKHGLEARIPPKTAGNSMQLHAMQLRLFLIVGAPVFPANSLLMPARYSYRITGTKKPSK